MQSVQSSNVHALPSLEERENKIREQRKLLQEEAKALAAEKAAVRKTMPRGMGRLNTIRKIVIADPTLKGEALHKKVWEQQQPDSNGNKSPTSVIDTLRSDLLGTIRVLRDLKAFNDEYMKRYVNI